MIIHNLRNLNGSCSAIWNNNFDTIIILVRYTVKRKKKHLRNSMGRVKQSLKFLINIFVFDFYHESTIKKKKYMRSDLRSFFTTLMRLNNNGLLLLQLRFFFFFHFSFNWLSFTKVRGTASLVKSPGLFWVFSAILTLWSVWFRFFPWFPIPQIFFKIIYFI